MVNLRKTAFATAVIAAGGALYLGLNWIPIIGPLAVGFAVGFMLKETPGNGFKAGVSAGSLGVVTMAFILATTGIFDPSINGTLPVLLTVWVLFIWNLLGIFLTGVGGLLGCVAGQTKRMFDALAQGFTNLPFGFSLEVPRPRRVIRLNTPPMNEPVQKTTEAEKKIRFTICPQCGSSNPEHSKTCGNCGHKLK